ncbi:MAG: ATP-binding protein [Victivallaceae bacterium]|nr:ATP-binding protein [Victivallaceae bacterium]
MMELLKKIILEFHTRNLDYVSPRDIPFPILDGKATVITGMRRTGKSSFCYQKIRELVASGVGRDRILFLNFEDDRILGLSMKDCQAILDAYYSLFPENRAKECYFFFDEIQNLPGWEHFVRRLIDTTNIHVIVTGSSSKMLTREIGSAMRGRSSSREVLPFSFTEYLKYHHVLESIPEHLSDDDEARLRNGMERYFRLGGFSETYKYPDSAVRTEILQQYSDVVVLRDVAERNGIANLTALRLLLRALYGQAARKFSVTGFWKVLSQGMGVKCAKNDLFDFMDFLEESCLIYRTGLLSLSEKARLVNPKKVYFVDVGLVRAMAEDPDADRGWLLENLVYLHLRRMGFSLDYVNTSDGKEIDFHAYNRITKEKQLVQVAWSISDPATRERETIPLSKAGRELGIERKLVVTWDEKAHLDDCVEAVPVWKYLAMSSHNTGK